MKQVIWILILAVTVLSQDKIIFMNGSVLKGEVDRTVLTETSKSIRFKPKGGQQFTFYNVDQINFVESWNGVTLYPVGVIVNTTSGRFHLPNVRHLPPKEKQKKFANDKEAIVKGFLPCSACFDTHPKISDYALEKSLVRAAILQIQSDHELMYEHPMLPKLQTLMKQILDHWPEELKGYDYRIQIIRDDKINAFAVAGGNLYFSTGMLQMIETDEELEAILAHEIAHVERRHMLRAFKDYQLKKAKLALVSSLLTLTAAVSESDLGIALAGIATDLGSFAVEFSRIGFGRDQEQEADMFAQIYLRGVGKDLQPMLAALDKLATNSKTRIGYVRQVNAFSSHPDLLSRISQIEAGVYHKYDEPLIMKLFSVNSKLELDPGFIEIIISHAYQTQSSDNKDQDEILLLGTIVNHHPELSFKINSITLNFLGSLGQTPLKGLDEVIVPYDGGTEFVARVNAPKELSEKTANSVFNKKLLPYSVDVSAIVLKAGGNALKAVGLQDIQCTMTIN